MQTKYYEAHCVILIEEDTKNGPKIKKMNEKFLIDAVTVMEAEEKIAKWYESTAMKWEYYIKSIKASSIVDVL